MTQQPPVHHPKNPVLRFHGWDEIVPQGSVHLVSIFFPFWSYFSQLDFFHWLSLFESFFMTFFPSPPTPSFFWGVTTCPQPNYRPSSYQPTYLPQHADPSPPTSITTIRESLNSSELQLGFKASLRMWRHTKL